jgi:hypothetical protein
MMIDPPRSRNSFAGTPIAVLPEASDMRSTSAMPSQQEHSKEYARIFEAESGPQTEPLDDQRQPLDDHGPYHVCVPPGTHR